MKHLNKGHLWGQQVSFIQSHLYSSEVHTLLYCTMPIVILWGVPRLEDLFQRFFLCNDYRSIQREEDMRDTTSTTSIAEQRDRDSTFIGDPSTHLQFSFHPISLPSFFFTAINLELFSGKQISPENLQQNKQQFLLCIVHVPNCVCVIAFLKVLIAFSLCEFQVQPA